MKSPRITVQTAAMTGYLIGNNQKSERRDTSLVSFGDFKWIFQLDTLKTLKKCPLSLSFFKNTLRFCVFTCYFGNCNSLSVWVQHVIHIWMLSAPFNVHISAVIHPIHLAIRSLPLPISLLIRTLSPLTQTNHDASVRLTKNNTSFKSGDLIASIFIPRSGLKRAMVSGETSRPPSQSPPLPALLWGHWGAPRDYLGVSLQNQIKKLL